MKRHKMSKRHSKKVFRKGADRTHKRNLGPSSTAPFIMRGGTRM